MAIPAYDIDALSKLPHQADKHMYLKPGYQCTGTSFLINNLQEGQSSLLGDDMGLGKTGE